MIRILFRLSLSIVCLCALTSTPCALEIKIDDGNIHIRLDEKADEDSSHKDSPEQGSVSIGTVESDSQGTEIHRRTTLENVTVIQGDEANPRIYHHQKDQR